MVLAECRKKTGFISRKPINRVPKISESQKKKITLMNSVSVNVSSNKNGNIIIKVVK